MKAGGSYHGPGASSGIHAAVRGEQPGGGVGVVQVPGAEPFAGGAAHRPPGLGGRAFGGVQAEQVVQPVAVAALVGEQVGGGQLVQDGPHDRAALAAERGGRRGRQTGAGGEGQQPEQGARGGGEGAVGEVERRADGRGRVVVDRQRGEQVPAVPQLGDVVGDGAAGAFGDPAGGDRQGERQPAADGGEFGDGGGLGPGPPGADDAVQQRDGVRRRRSGPGPVVGRRPGR